MSKIIDEEMYNIINAIVREIRTSSLSSAVLGKEHNVASGTIRAVRSKRRWKHVI